MQISRDIQSISELKQNASKLVKQVQETREPIVLTVNGKPAAILQDVESYETLLSKDEIHRSAAVLRERLADIEDPSKWMTHEEVFSGLRGHIESKKKKS